MTNTWATLPVPTQAGQVGGHEGVGKIVKMGPGTEKAAVKVGDRVGIKWMAGICESCEACRAGADANCFKGVSSSLLEYDTLSRAFRISARSSTDIFSRKIESLGLLHPRHIPAIRRLPSKLRDPYSRRPRLCSRGTSALRGRHSILCSS